MSDDLKLEYGRKAKAVLENETVLEAMDFITAALTAQWRHTTTAQAPHREALHAQIAGLDAIKAQMRSWVDAAKAVEIQRAKAAQRKPNPLRVIGR